MLACQKAPERVRQYNPDMKFIVLLRNPVHRAWSAYQYARQMGWEKDDVSFADALSAEDQRRKSDNSRIRLDTVYGYNGLYGKHLNHWMKVFPADQFLILLSDDLRYRTSSCLERIWEFLGVSSAVKIDTSTEYNRAGRARARWLNSVMYDRSSSLPRIIGRLVPAQLRVWVRSRVFPWLNRINTAESVSARMPDDVAELMTEYYRDDLRGLEQKFHIKL